MKKLTNKLATMLMISMCIFCNGKNLFAQKTNEPRMNTRITSPTYIKYKHGSTEIAMLPTTKNQGRFIEWIMAVAGERDEAGVVWYEGQPYLPVGIPGNLIDRQADWMEGKNGVLGMVYTPFKDKMVNPIEDITISPMTKKGEAVFQGFENIYEVKIQVQGEKFPLFTSFEYDPETEKFPWYQKKVGIREKYFSKDEKVPKEYKPLITLRVFGLPSYDGMSTSPQFNSQGIARLNRLAKEYVQVVGMNIIAPTKSGNIVVDALALKKISDMSIINIEPGVLINYGDGRYQIFPVKSGVDGRQVLIIPTDARRLKIGQLIFEPIDENTWNCRNEHLKPTKFGF